MAYLEPVVELNWRDAPKMKEKSDQIFILIIGEKTNFLKRWVRIRLSATTFVFFIY